MCYFKGKTHMVNTPSYFDVLIVKLETTKLRYTDEYPQTLANIL